MNFVSLTEEMHKMLINELNELRTENEKLKQHVTRQNDLINKVRNRLINQENEDKMSKYVEKIKGGVKKPRYNYDIDEKTVLNTILKLNTTNMYKIADELKTTYSTIRRRLIEFKQYPINLQDIRDVYMLFYSVDKE